MPQFVFKELAQISETTRVGLVKSGLLPCDAAASQNKAVVELSQSMRLGLMPSDTALSQRNALKELVSVGEAWYPAA